MKLSCTRLIPACLILALPGAALSAEISVDATSIVRFEQRAPTGAPKKDVIPATQFLGLDADKLADGNLSFHAYGWGRADIRDKSFNEDLYGGSLTYGYLQYRFNAANADVRLGRFSVHEGIVNEQIDGASFRTDLPFGFGLSAFGGANVHTKKLVATSVPTPPSSIYFENSDGKGDANMGGRLSYRYKGVLELGASGQYETKAPKLVNYTNVNHRTIGGDVWFSPHRSVEIMGHTSYNIETKGVAENTYLMNIKPIKHLVLTGEYNEHRERNYFYTWVSFSNKLSLNDPAVRSRSIGGSASYEIGKGIELAGDYKHYTREFGNADRFGGEVKLSFLNNALRSGLGYHYLRAGKEFSPSGNPSASYHELRGYILHDAKSYLVSVDLLDYIFKDKVYNEQSAWEAIASLGYKITPELVFSGDVSYGRNPEFIEEVKGLVRLTYNLAYDSKGGKK